MFKNFNELLTFFTLIEMVIFVFRFLLFSAIDKEKFSIKDQIKYYYNNEDE